MAIKTRKPASPEAIEAFGAAADEPTAPAPKPAEPPTAAESPEPAPRADRAPAQREPEDAGTTWPRGLAKTVTLRYPDPTLPQLLAELAELDERSQHNVAIRALRRGLDDLKREHGL